MKNEFKRAMKLVWGNKRLRGTFGCGFGMNLNECGWLLVLMGLCAVAPLVSLLFGVQLSEIWILRLLGFQAFVNYVMLVWHMTSMFGRYGKLGKAFGGFPMAKYVMTKGYVINTWVLLAIGVGLTMTGHGLCLLTGSVPTARFVEILLFFSVGFLLNGLCLGIRYLSNPVVEMGSIFAGTCLIGLKMLADNIAENGASTGKNVFWIILCLGLGTVFLYLFSKKRYKKRDTVALEVLREE